MITKKMIVAAVARVRTRKLRGPVMAQCGHVTPAEAELDVRGELLTIKVPLDAGRRPYFCVDCFASRCISCAFCGRVLLPFEWVSLPRVSGSYQVRPDSLRYGDRVVTCLHPDCRNENERQCGMLLPSAVNATVFVAEVYDTPEAYEYAILTSRHQLELRHRRT